MSPVAVGEAAVEGATVGEALAGPSGKVKPQTDPAVRGKMTGGPTNGRD